MAGRIMSGAELRRQEGVVAEEKQLEEKKAERSDPEEDVDKYLLIRSLIDSLTLGLFINPQITVDGQTYEHDELKVHFDLEEKKTRLANSHIPPQDLVFVYQSPLTGTVLKSREVKPNFLVKGIAEEYKKEIIPRLKKLDQLEKNEKLNLIALEKMTAANAQLNDQMAKQWFIIDEQHDQILDQLAENVNLLAENERLKERSTVQEGQIAAQSVQLEKQNVEAKHLHEENKRLLDIINKREIEEKIRNAETFLSHVRFGRYMQARQSLLAGVEVNTCDANQNTALHLLAINLVKDPSQGALDFLSLLLSYEPDRKLRNNKGEDASACYRRCSGGAYNPAISLVLRDQKYLGQLNGISSHSAYIRSRLALVSSLSSTTHFRATTSAVSSPRESSLRSSLARYNVASSSSFGSRALGSSSSSSSTASSTLPRKPFK
jgi:hypothetical protein